MATIVYLDAEDEITSAAARIRAAADTRVGLVLPFGSRVATSRINFRLLSREAMSHGRRLDIVAPDASARALAASAGLPVFGSVAEYEAALDVEDEEKDARRAEAWAAAGLGGTASASAGRPADARAGGASGGEGTGATTRQATPAARASSASALDDTAVRPRSAARPEKAAIGAAAVGGVGAASVPVAHPPRRRRRVGLVVGVLLFLILVGGSAAVGGYLLLPSAAIVVTPRIEPVGPVSLDVRADPAATEVDTDAGVVPARTLTVPVDADGEFAATGKRVARTAAHGGVRWTNCDPTAAYTVPSGTVVRTASGIGFTTDEQVFLPVATLSGGGANPKLNCQTSEVAVTAVDPGPGGNVGAGEIRVVPARYNRTVIRVTNPQPTTGGTREEFTRISQKDVDGALQQLGKDLQGRFATEVRNPSRVPPGTTVFPDTAELGDAVPKSDPQALVGQEVDSFTLGVTADGTVLAVDPTPAKAIAEKRLAATIDKGYELVDGSTKITVGDGKVVDGVVTYPVEASARQVRPLDAAALKASVLGLSQADAQKALQRYGDVSITLWPDWVHGVPTLDQRVTLTVGTPVGVTPSPAASPRAGSSTAPSPGSTGRAGGDQPVPSAG
jgi:hypothetical protein